MQMAQKLEADAKKSGDKKLSQLAHELREEKRKNTM